MHSNVMFMLRKLSVSVKTWNQKHTNQEDLTPVQVFVLAELLKQKDAPNYSTNLSDETGFSKGTISAILKVLRQKGYIRMVDVEEDNRKKGILLTEKAFEAEAAATAWETEAQKRLCADVSEEDLKSFEKTVKQMLQNMKESKEDINDQNITQTFGAI